MVNEGRLERGRGRVSITVLVILGGIAVLLAHSHLVRSEGWSFHEIQHALTFIFLMGCALFLFNAAYSRYSAIVFFQKCEAAYRDAHAAGNWQLYGRWIQQLAWVDDGTFFSSSEEEIRKCGCTITADDERWIDRLTKNFPESTMAIAGEAYRLAHANLGGDEICAKLAEEGFRIDQESRTLIQWIADRISRESCGEFRYFMNNRYLLNCGRTSSMLRSSDPRGVLWMEAGVDLDSLPVRATRDTVEMLGRVYADQAMRGHFFPAGLSPAMLFVLVRCVLRGVRGKAVDTEGVG